MTLSTGLSVAGLVLLGWVALAGVQSPVDIEDIGKHAGQHVCVVAALAQVRTTSWGATNMLLVDENASLSATTRSTFGFQAGDIVRTCGVVEQRDGVWTLQIASSSATQLVRAYDERGIRLTDVALEPWRFRDQHVALVCAFDEDGRRIYAKSIDDSARMRASGLRQAVSGVWLVQGFVEFDEDESQFLLRIRGLEAGPMP